MDIKSYTGKNHQADPGVEVLLELKNPCHPNRGNENFLKPHYNFLTDVNLINFLNLLTGLDLDHHHCRLALVRNLVPGRTHHRVALIVNRDRRQDRPGGVDLIPRQRNRFRQNRPVRAHGARPVLGAKALVRARMKVVPCVRRNTVGGKTPRDRG